MMRALYSAVSGLTGNMLRLDVIGNNIANVNTTGFKAGRVVFEETFAQLQRAAGAPGDSRGGTNPLQVGTGSQMAATSQLYTQGSLQLTGVATDLAIEGNALFVLSDGSQQLYTRDGAFQLDGYGRLVSPTSGALVQGYAYDRGSEAFATQLAPITISPHATEPARATGAVVLAGNLDADSAARGTCLQSGALYDDAGLIASDETTLVALRNAPSGETALVAAGETLGYSALVGSESVAGSLTVTATTTLGDLLTALDESLNETSAASGLTAALDQDGRLEIRSPDALGTQGAITALGFTREDGAGATTSVDGWLSLATLTAAREASSFDTETTVYDALGFAHAMRLTFTRETGANAFLWSAELDGGETAIEAGASGRVTFGADGTLQQWSYDASGGRAVEGLSFHPTTGANGPVLIDLAAASSGGESLTMLRSTGELATAQDGYGTGEFLSFQIDELGQVQALFSNGVLRPLARLALAMFVNPGGLTRTGNNAYQANANSGTPVIGVSGETIEATISAGALEQSNVDLTEEFTNMIVAQRGFQANARVITTSDELLAELMNLRR